MSLRGAISGFGEVAAQAHLAGWRTRTEVRIVAIHDPVSERRHHALRLMPNVRVYDDLELMLDGERPDFVDIASPPAWHAATALSALAAGAHVVVEKPLCLAADEFTRLCESASSRRRVLMCVHNWKQAAAYRIAHDLIDSGRLGEVCYVALDRLRTAPAGLASGSGTSGRWRTAASSGGGILIDHGWHVFYLMRWLMGEVEPVSVSALIAGASNGIEDVADIRVNFSDGRMASSHLSWRAPMRRTRAMIYGSEAALEVDGDRVVLTARSGASTDITASPEVDDSYHSAWFAGVAAEFEQAVREGPESAVAVGNLAEARVALGLLEAARASGASGGALVKLG